MPNGFQSKDLVTTKMTLVRNCQFASLSEIDVPIGIVSVPIGDSQIEEVDMEMRLRNCGNI